MDNNSIIELISNYYQELSKESAKDKQVESNLINTIILKRGKFFVEQKFYFIVESINQITKQNISPIDLYAKIFSELMPRITTIDKVFENTINNSSTFKHLYHPSEYIYKYWLENFESCFLIEKINEKIFINLNNCKEVLSEFKLWILNYKQVRGSLIESNIRREIGELSFDKPIKYEPKNPFVKTDLLTQLEKNNPIQIETNKDLGNKIEIKLSNSKITLTRKKKYPVTPILLKDWLNKFGISVSLTTVTYLIEYGMSYGGNLITLNSLLEYTDRSYGVIGILAFQLNFLIQIYESSKSEIELIHHPLRQSVVLGLSRLEHYLNPKLF